MARPKVKSNKNDTFTYRQERNDMSGRIAAAKAAIEDVFSIADVFAIGKGSRSTGLRIKS